MRVWSGFSARSKRRISSPRLKLIVKESLAAARDAIKEKNLESEIETLLMNIDKNSGRTPIKEKNLESEIETIRFESGTLMICPDQREESRVRD